MSEEPARSHPLVGRRVLVTRAPHQASELADRLRDAGAEPILIPTIQIAEPASTAALDAALRSIQTFDWLVFTSANAVEAFARRADTLQVSPAPRRIAAIGPATERAVRALGLSVELVPETAIAESLADALAPRAARAHILLVRAAEARDVLPEALRAAGATVTIAEAYRNEIASGSIAALKTVLATPDTSLDAITFTSASTARNLAALLAEAGLVLPPTVVRASIGPITSAAMRELGIPPHVQAREASVPALVSALSAHFSFL